MAEQDDRLAKTVIEQGLVTEQQMDTARKMQAEQTTAGSAVPLVTVLIKQGFLTQTQADTVQEKARGGAIQKIGDFEIVGKLGEGGMGTVLKARQVSMDRFVALKLLPPHLARDPGLVARFQREARTSAKLDHANIVRGIAVGEEDGQHYFAMEFIEGTDVMSMIDERGKLGIKESLDIIIQVAKALVHAHERGMIHRDIKPDNIMITKDNVAKLADLGLVKESDAQFTRVTQSGAAMGTPYYMPPEQAKDAKRADERSDIYALGATFYHMVTGQVPYGGDSAYEIMQKHEEGRLKGPRSLRSEIPTKLSLTIEKMMHRNPENRHQNARELLEALESFAGIAPAPETKKRTEEVAAAAAARAKARPGDRFWHVRIPQKGGKHKGMRAETDVLRTAIAKGKLPRTVLVRRGTEGEFRPLSQFPELLRTATRVRHSRKKPGVTRNLNKQLSEVYQAIDAERKKRRGLLSPEVKTALVILLLAALGVLGYVFRAQIMAFFKK